MASQTGSSAQRYRYRAPVLEELGAHGIQPRGHTPPAVVRELLNDLYTFELRRLRGCLLRREFPKASYAARVVAIRRRYPLLSIPIDEWAEPEAADGDPSDDGHPTR